MSSVLRRPLAAVGLLSLVAAGSLVVSGAASAHVAAHHWKSVPMIRPKGSQTVAGNSKAVQLSLNWSGYAVTSTSKFNYVHTEFVQPAVKCNGKKFSDASQWVGLDGFNSGTVEQDGTDAHCVGPDHMTPVYHAWYEMFPAVSVPVFQVKPGDVIDAQVTFKSGLFTTTITDVTSGKSAATSARCSQCERSSAEWVVERPVFCGDSACDKGILAILPNFRTATFNNATAGVDGARATSISSFKNIPIDMYTPGKPDKLLDQAESLTQQGHSFQVVWQRFGKPLEIQF